MSGKSCVCLSADAGEGRCGQGTLSSRLLSTFMLAVMAGGLVACGGETPPPAPESQVTVAQEEARYRAHAKSYYAPPGPESDPWGPYITEASGKFDVPELWIRSVIDRESGGRMYNKGELITSAPGAMGLMQLMPPTYDALRSQYNLGDDPYDPHDNIMAGTAYIRQMYDIYGSPGFLAAYNAGPGRLEDFLTRNRTLPRETRNYVYAIGHEIAGVNPVNRSQADLLVEAHTTGDSAAYAAAAQSSDETNSVRAAWQQRSGDSTASSEADSVRMAWQQRDGGAVSSGADSVRAAWQQRDGGAAMASDADSVRAAWQQRVGASSPQATEATYASAAPLSVSDVWSRRLSGGAGNTTAGTASEPIQAAEASESAPVPPPSSAPVYNRAGDQPPVSASPPPRTLTLPTERPAQVTGSSRNVQANEAALAALVPSRAPVTRGGAQANPFRSLSAPATTRDWGIQVGAFATAAQASSATSRASATAGSALRGAQPQVMAVNAPSGKLYRARLTGITRESAISVCRRLEKTPGSCIVVSPGSS